MTKPAIPEAALSQHIAIVGKTGSGKTYTAKGALVEPLLAAGRRVCVIDPTGVWWGLRSSADGKHAGFAVAVFGGEHADVPIVAGSGAALAELVAKSNMPAVIDLSEFLIGDRHRFMEDFAATLYRDNRMPLHLIIDEADEFAPQNPLPETKRMLHRVDQIVRRGRVRGFRIMLITQRPAVLHKNVLTQANVLIAMRLTAPQDRKAIEDWIKGQADVAQGREVLNTLARLQLGEGWVWAPEQDVLHRTQFSKIRTFDSSRTPEDGEQIAAPTKLADVDLQAIRGSLEEAVAEAAQNDPKALRARIAELERQQGKPAGASATELAAEYTRGRTDGFDAALSGLTPFIERAATLQGAIDEQLGGFIDDLRRHGRAALYATTPAVDATERAPAAPSRGFRVTGPADPATSRPMIRAFLTALAQHPDGLTKGQILVHTDYRSSGDVSKCFAELARNAWVTAPNAGALRITDAGLTALGPYEPLPTGAALRAMLLTSPKLATAEKKILEVLFSKYPHAIAKGAILELTGYRSSGDISKAFAKLVVLGYARKAGRGELKAADELFQ